MKGSFVPHRHCADKDFAASHLSDGYRKCCPTAEGKPDHPAKAGRDALDPQRRELAQPSRSFMLRRMDLLYPINFVGRDEWMKSVYALDLSGGDVITRDGEVLGSWRVAGYDPEADDEGGRYEFVLDGQDVVMFAEEFAFLDYRTSRGLALSMLTRAIKEWHEAQPT